MMKSILSGIAIIFLIPGIMTAASTKLQSSWKNPLAGAIRQDSKMAAFLIDPDTSMREGPEETLSSEIRSRGIDCRAGYMIVPATLAKDTDKAKEFIKKMGITHAILMRVMGNENRSTYVPGVAMYSGPQYRGFWNYWDYGWTTVYAPGYLKTDKVISLEILLYSVEKDMLVWGGISETTNPKDVRKLAKDIVDVIGKELRKAGLLQK